MAKCGYCGLDMLTKSEDRHYQHVHTNIKFQRVSEREVQCGLCRHRCQNLTSLVAHYKFEHPAVLATDTQGDNHAGQVQEVLGAIQETFDSDSTIGQLQHYGDLLLGALLRLIDNLREQVQKLLSELGEKDEAIARQEAEAAEWKTAYAKMKRERDKLIEDAQTLNRRQALDISRAIATPGDGSLNDGRYSQ